MGRLMFPTDAEVVEAMQRARETANATRPTPVYVARIFNAETFIEREAHRFLTVEFGGLNEAERLCHSLNALAGIANPSAIPALIEAARAWSARYTYTDEFAYAMKKAIDALDAEPVA